MKDYFKGLLMTHDLDIFMSGKKSRIKWVNSTSTNFHLNLRFIPLIFPSHRVNSGTKNIYCPVIYYGSPHFAFKKYRSVCHIGPIKTAT